MTAEDLKLRKAWQDIAERACHEHNPKKLARLAQKLIDVLDDQARQCRAEQKMNRSAEHKHQKGGLAA
jgi:hypothetical protein